MKTRAYIGDLAQVGRNVSDLRVGDEVFAATVGFGGGWAEYVLADRSAVCLKPARLTFEEAAAVPIVAGRQRR
jgi:NADPH:quinone reductase-like Zn-dependent oxidoreductase